MTESARGASVFSLIVSFLSRGGPGRGTQWAPCFLFEHYWVPWKVFVPSGCAFSRDLSRYKAPSRRIGDFHNASPRHAAPDRRFMVDVAPNLIPKIDQNP